MCSYCSSPMQPARELETWEILGLIDGLAKQGMVRIGLTGGEPLLRDDIGQIVDRCAQLGVWTTLETNGYEWVSRADELSRLNRLMVSLDGPEPVHDRLHRRCSVACGGQGAANRFVVAIQIHLQNPNRARQGREKGGNNEPETP